MLDDRLLRRLDAFALVLRARSSGGSGGLRRSHSFGSSVEFSDFRDYAPGDDLRRLDWNAYARFDRLFLKLFLEEQQSCLRIALDASASMDSGTPDKWRFACRLAAMLAYLSLLRYDRVILYALSDSQVSMSRSFSGRGAYPEVVAFLESLQPHGATHLNSALSRLSTSGPRGLCAVISDLLDEDGIERGLGSLAFRKQEIAVLQVLSPQERIPELSGAVRLIDAEGAPPCDVHVTPDALRSYQQALEAFINGHRAHCHKHGFLYALFDSGMDMEREAMDTLMRQGIIAAR